MGFFDDLESELGDGTNGEAAPPPTNDFDLVLDKLKGGWTFKRRRAQPGTDKRSDGEYQEVVLSFEDGRYVMTTRMVQVQGKQHNDMGAPTTRRLDREGMIDVFHEMPWVAQGAQDEAGRS